MPEFIQKLFRKKQETEQPQKDLILSYDSLMTKYHSEYNRDDDNYPRNTTPQQEEALRNISQKIIEKEPDQVTRAYLASLIVNDFPLSDKKENMEDQLGSFITKIILSLDRGSQRLSLPNLGKETLLWAIDIARTKPARQQYDHTQPQTKDNVEIINAMSSTVINDKRLGTKSLKEIKISATDFKLIPTVVIHRLIYKELLGFYQIIITMATQNEEANNFLKKITEEVSQKLNRPSPQTQG
jgi:lysyl-tRNA synthetase class I